MTHPHFTRVAATEGYTPHRSFRPGERVPIHAASRRERVSVRVTSAFDDDILWSTTALQIEDHDVADRAWAEGCDWPVAFEIPTDASWAPGLHLVHFDDGEDGIDNPAWFVLGGTEPTRPLLVLATNTWNAYNQWGGRCMYTGAAHLSFERPLEHGYLTRPTDADGFDGRIASVVPGDLEHERLQRYQSDHDLPLWTASSGWFSFERRFVEWAAEQGIALDYALDIDLHRDPDLLTGRPVLLTVGHSEYWSGPMRDHVDTWVDGGGRWMILSGNTSFWQVRIDDHVMTCHKGRARLDDPAMGDDRATLTSMWSDPIIGRSENTSIGLSFTRGGYHRVGRAVGDGPGGYTVHRPEHWAVAGTGVAAGDLVGGDAITVGYEVDGCAMDDADPPSPTGEDGTPLDFEIIASAPARLISITEDVCEAPVALWASVDPPGDLEGTSMILFGDASPDNVARIADGRCVMGTFRRGAGEVFNAGSADFVHGLVDPVISRITANVLARFMGS